MHPALKNFRPAKRQHQALIELAGDPDGCVTIATDGERILAYAAFQRPEAFERWGKDETGGVYELGAIEVAPECRKRGLAKRLLEETFKTGRFDDKVVVAALYYWHYDLGSSGLSAYAYKEMLERLYKSVGFVPFTTDDPDIFPYVENALLARIGERAPKEVVESFRFAEDQGPWGCL